MTRAVCRPAHRKLNRVRLDGFPGIVGVFLRVEAAGNQLDNELANTLARFEPFTRLNTGIVLEETVLLPWTLSRTFLSWE